ncbi:hypothetical protein [Streptomyces sp. NPDC057301]|uniref:hypothetical protein n=1 Tax=Streptomyces sp. NPDC057301 TaxID=3346093 RepID=UPI0036259D08
MLRNPDVKAKGETVFARAQLHRSSEGLDLHGMALDGWAETDAKARMAALRSALEKCGSIEYENIDTNGVRRARFQEQLIRAQVAKVERTLR